MKTTVALLTALVTLVPHSANAGPLRITAGTVLLEFHAFADFEGRNFSVSAGHESPVNAREAFGVDPFTWTLRLGPPALVRVGGEQCDSPLPDLHCGEITLTHAGFAMPDDWPRTTLFTRSVPFTATGFLLVDGMQYEITGMGTVTGEGCLDISTPGCRIPFDLPFLQGNYTDTLVTYTMAEPPTRLSTLAFAITLLGIVFVHRRVGVKSESHGSLVSPASGRYM